MQQAPEIMEILRRQRPVEAVFVAHPLEHRLGRRGARIAENHQRRIGDGQMDRQEGEAHRSPEHGETGQEPERDHARGCGKSRREFRREFHGARSSQAAVKTGVLWEVSYSTP